MGCTRTRRTLGILALAAGLGLAGPSWTRGARAGQLSETAPADDRVLAGAIDVHVHSLPDSENWRMDGLEIAKLARARGMRGIVLKSHWESTAAMAYFVRKEVPGLEVFGGLGISTATGGMNPAAVEQLANVTGGWGKVVWMPTLETRRANAPPGDTRPFVAVSRDGELLPDTKAVIGVIARRGLVLATGHSPADEAVLLVREARRQGVEHIVITHAMSAPVRMTIAQMREVAALGAFVEIVYVHSQTVPELKRTANYSIPQVAQAIREVGAGAFVLSTDMGQVGLPLPPDGLARFAAALRAEGISDRDLARMIKENPARLLGLPVLP